MERAIIAAVVIGVAVVAALILQRRPPDAPTQPRQWAVPAQLDRHDFVRPDAPWLVVLFSSITCESCAGTWARARLLESKAVAVQEVEVGARRDLHDRYGIEAVPTLVVADGEGVVRTSFLGQPTAADLWAAVADVRET